MERRSDKPVVHNFDVVARQRASRFTRVERYIDANGGAAMSVSSSAVSYPTTSQDRWLRWQQGGDANDARLMSRAKGVLGAALLAIVVIGALLLVR
jgi:hypothetical protein